MPSKSFALVLFTIALLFITVHAGIYSSSDPVTVLTDSNFDKLVVKSNEVWVVEFYSDGCGHCHAFKDAYLAAAKAMLGVIKFGIVDGASQRSIAGKYQIQGFPTVKIFGADKNSPVDYNGAREAKPLATAALKEVREMVSARLGGKSSSSSSGSSNTGSKSTTGNGSVVELTAATFKSDVLKSAEVWLVAFTATWCGHCKNLAAPYAAAAKQFAPTSPVRFAKIDCPSHQAVCQDYGVQGYPTIKLFVNGKPQDYNGGRDTSDFVTFMRNQENKAKPTPKPLELLNQEQFDKCLEETICIFASLPDIRDVSVDERKKHIQILTDAAAKNKQYNIQWVYSFARQHRDLENALQMGQNGFPSIVLLHKGKSVYSPLYRAFTLDNISDWAGNAGLGRVSQTIEFKQVPAVSSVQPWDGKAYVAKDEL